MNVSKKVQDGWLYQSLSGLPQKIVLSQVTVDIIIADDGVENIVCVLNTCLLRNEKLYFCQLHQQNICAYALADLLITYIQNLERWYQDCCLTVLYNVLKVIN